jgi:hypothetical protein
MPDRSAPASTPISRPSPVLVADPSRREAKAQPPVASTTAPARIVQGRSPRRARPRRAGDGPVAVAQQLQGRMVVEDAHALGQGQARIARIYSGPRRPR